MRMVRFLPVLFLSACGPFTPLELDQTLIQDKRIIAITGPGEPDHYDLYDSSGEFGAVLGAVAAGVAGGPIAGQAATGSAASTLQGGTPLDAAAAASGYKVGEEIQNELSRSLQAQGFVVIPFDAPRGTFVRFSFASSYENAPANADLILDSSIQVSYDNGRTDNFIPYLQLNVRLLDRRRKPIMVAIGKCVYHGEDRHRFSDSDIISDPRFSFASSDELRKSVARALEGIHSGVAPVARCIAALLKH